VIKTRASAPGNLTEKTITFDETGRIVEVHWGQLLDRIAAHDVAKAPGQRSASPASGPPRTICGSGMHCCDEHVAG
jgi:hypothetical protein